MRRSVIWILSLFAGFNSNAIATSGVIRFYGTFIEPVCTTSIQPGNRNTHQVQLLDCPATAQNTDLSIEPVSALAAPTLTPVKISDDQSNRPSGTPYVSKAYQFQEQQSAPDNTRHYTMTLRYH